MLSSGLNGHKRVEGPASADLRPLSTLFVSST